MEIVEFSTVVRIPYVFSENYIYRPGVNKKTHKPYLYLSSDARTLKTYITKVLKETIPIDILGVKSKKLKGCYKIICDKKNFDITNSLKLLEDSVMEAFEFLNDKHVTENVISYMTLNEFQGYLDKSLEINLDNVYCNKKFNEEFKVEELILLQIKLRIFKECNE